ncbi:hypothetical protein Vadar_024467 [Vaccinium darrowii]|uniref:Uncharacterized protein n=1 Tax=Vaccinium darrowii TaxID=229202 RepID=A0ACB7ZML3_9ERIC|nr:hypothetical protein Vadar_024467 [Vaccinium darrowii]
MEKVELRESCKPQQFAAECWFDDACILDMDYFVRTLSGIKAKGVRPDIIGSIITHDACKWLPELSGDDKSSEKNGPTSNSEEPSPEGTATASWMKKRFFVKTIVGILPPEKDSIPCNFLLRLLRAANRAGVEPVYRAELEKRISWQLDQASLKELMIPSFSHTCETLLDVELVLRLVKGFVNLNEAVRGGAALVKVAKLVDSYLAEAAVDSNLSLLEFTALAGALPGHARSMDDGLYRAIDTYLKAHPWMSKQDRKTLCRLMDSRKLYPEASLHAAQNERLPVRAVIQVLFSKQTKITRQFEWSGSCSGMRSSPKLGLLEPPARCLSKGEVTAQQTEINRLRDDVLRLQSQCIAMQGQIERMLEKKSTKGFFRWKMFGMGGLRSGGGGGVAERIDEGEGDGEYGRQTPIAEAAVADGQPLFEEMESPKFMGSLLYCYCSFHRLLWSFWVRFVSSYRVFHPTALADKLLATFRPRFLGPLAIVRIWSFCLFYVMAELWGSVVISVLFWGFANQITTVEEAKRFYPLFGLGANVALIFSGRTVKYFSNMRQNLGPGVDGWAISFFSSNSLHNTTPLPWQEKPKVGTMESIKFLVSSRYIRDLATLVVAYGISIKLVEVTWKSKLKAQFPSPNEYSSFMGDFATATGIATFIMMLLCQWIFDKYGWGAAAKITPTVLLLTGVGFFSLILFGAPLAPAIANFGMTPLLAAVYVGALQNIFSKSAKYSLFDPCKEMAYIPLDEETKVCCFTH